jgi:hypothetical protein
VLLDFVRLALVLLDFAVDVIAGPRLQTKEVFEIAFGVYEFVVGKQLHGLENFLNNILEGPHVIRLIQIEN